MADLSTITETHTALEQCGDLFRTAPVACNLVASALAPTAEFELFRAAADGATLGAAVRIGNTCTLTALDTDAAALVGDVLPIDDKFVIEGPAGAATEVAGRWMNRSGGSVSSIEFNRMYRLGTLQEPSKRRKGKAFTSERERLEAATLWNVGYGTATGRPRTIDEARTSMEQAVNESRLIEWRVKGEVVAQLVISAARFGVVRIRQVYTPPEVRKRGHAAALTAAVAAQQLERQKVDEIILITQATNPATNRLYGRLGFEPFIELLHISLVPGRPPALSQPIHRTP